MAAHGPASVAIIICWHLPFRGCCLHSTVAAVSVVEQCHDAVRRIMSDVELLILAILTSGTQTIKHVVRYVIDHSHVVR